MFQFCSFSFVDLYLRAEKLWNEDNYVDAESSFHQLLLLYETAEHEPFKKAHGKCMCEDVEIY